MLRPLRVARQQRAFVVARNALRKDRVADRDPVIVAIAVDQFVPRPACADMVDDHLAAILYGEAVLRPAMGAGAVVAHADMADDDVVRVLDEDRRAPFRAARMGDDDAAARRRLPRSEEHTSELQS